MDLGDHDLRTVSETKNQFVRVQTIVPHVQYEPIRKDLALLKLAYPVRLDKKNIRTVCLPSDAGKINQFLQKVTIVS